MAEVSRSVIQYEREAHQLKETNDLDWSISIFLPFNPIFKLFVLVSVIIKSTLGPIQAVYPIVNCSDLMDNGAILIFIKYMYLYGCDSIYGVDTLLHIIHRQVTDKAMRKEYLPKSACLILLDIISLIPFYRLMVTDNCPVTQMWPNLMAFSEVLIIYRVVEYFSLVTTHSYLKITIGFTLMMIMCINSVTCFWLLLTHEGLCDSCDTGIYDWRTYVIHKVNETHPGFPTYVLGSAFILAFVINKELDDIKPSTILEFYMTCLFMVCGYAVSAFIVMPKAFAESVLRLRGVCSRHEELKKIIEETKRRNPDPKAHDSVQNFYTLIWKNRNGITRTPKIITEVPRYLRLEIGQDIVWQFFYHSPTLRKTSDSFKRYLSDYVEFDYKLAGQRFYSGPHSHTHLYYIKSGIVQFVSKDEGSTPILSVTSGTILGDVNFFVPPMHKKVNVNCRSYCEVYFCGREHLIRAMHKYPKDCIYIRKQIKERLEHANTLFACKKRIRGAHRAEDEGISWLIKRWWEISAAMQNWKKKTRDYEEYRKCELPPEETPYHCAKFIGQLVLCAEEQLKLKSMFVNVTFPWILTSENSFGEVWRYIVVITVFAVLLLYPTNLSKSEIPVWFQLFQNWTDFVYVTDICVSLMTCLSGQEQGVVNFTTVFFARCKKIGFILDILATIWTEHFVMIIGKPELYKISQFNRLIKIHVLFVGDYVHFNIKRNPIGNVVYKIMLTHFSLLYITSFLLYDVVKRIPEVTVSYFFGERFCKTEKETCDPADPSILGVLVSWTFEMLFCEYLPHHINDIYIAIIIAYSSYIFYEYCKMRLIACLYVKFNEIGKYQYLVSNLKTFYKQHKIHPDLLKRLERYLNVHWKYYHGVEMLNPNSLRKEPYDVYWKVQGEISVKIIGESKAFIGADQALIKELAYAAKPLILPRNATIILFGSQSKSVTWIVQGQIKCEFHDENGQLLSFFPESGIMMSLSSVFLGKAALRTYTAHTDCEILYIPRQQFFKIIQRYPNEWSYFQKGIKEFSESFDEIFEKYVLKHRDYQHKLREKLYSSRMNTVNALGSGKLPDIFESHQSPLQGEYWGDPESEFMKNWFLIRAITVFVSITAAALQGGVGANYRWTLTMIGSFCDCIALTDIVLKLFLSYYDERGLLISNKRLCLIHYLTRGFLLDVIGTVPVEGMLDLAFTEPCEDDEVMLLNTFCKFAHLYILNEYFNYKCDTPSMHVMYLRIIKWQIINLLLLMGLSHYLMTHCIDFTFDEDLSITKMQYLNTCWTPKFLKLNGELNLEQMHLIFINSLNLAQSGLTNMNFGRFRIDRDHLGVGSSLLFSGIAWWFISCYSITILVLSIRGNTQFRHGVNQLVRFLEDERVEQPLIDRVVLYFRYIWVRTKGINIHQLTYERLGLVFRQDLSYYFYKTTFLALDTILLGGEALERELASATTQAYFLPQQDIVREMNVLTSVYIVHRGKVTISQDGEKIGSLTKGSIFGLLDGSKPRAGRITAVADVHTDLLQIPVKIFQDIITDEVRKNISENSQSSFDYMAPKKTYPENPDDTVAYLLRGRRTIQLPWMPAPVEAKENWYLRWLCLSWFCAPLACAFIVIVLGTLPQTIMNLMYWVLALLDLIHLANFLAEFYTLDLVIQNNKCVMRRVCWRVFKRWRTYFDILSLVIPLFTIFTGQWQFQLARLLRLMSLYDFDVHFCRNFMSQKAPILMKFAILGLLIHTFTCGWIYTACRHETFPIRIPPLSKNVNKTIDYDQWVLPSVRKGGCIRVTKAADMFSNINFVKPKYWAHDYIVALTYILLIQTHNSMDSVVSVSAQETCYKIIISWFMYLIDILIVATTINWVYTKYRKLYQYDYEVKNLTTYLNNSGLTPCLTESVIKYTKQLWKRQRGNWLPELVTLAPACLREDMFCSLYIYHLDAPPIYRKLPFYFKRQMASRFKRVVIFPGKCIIREGDIFSCTYFVHEGEVEKWYTDENGDSTFMSLLYTNGYFGTLPGLLQNTSFQFSYYTRTLVDLVYLRFTDWEDLLESYPDVRRDLHATAREIKMDLVKESYGKTLRSHNTVLPSLEKDSSIDSLK